MHRHDEHVQVRYVFSDWSLNKRLFCLRYVTSVTRFWINSREHVFVFSLVTPQNPKVSVLVRVWVQEARSRPACLPVPGAVPAAATRWRHPACLQPRGIQTCNF